MDALTTVENLDRDQRSIVLYAESVCVDNGGLLEGQRMNATDHANLDLLQTHGFLRWGRIPFAVLDARPAHFTSRPTHWVVLTEEGWALAHAARRQRSKQRGPYAEEVWTAVAERQLEEDAA